MTDRGQFGAVRELGWDDVRRFDVLLLTSLVWFMAQFLRFVFPPLFGTIQAQFGVSNAETGLLFTLLMVGYAAMQFPAGYLADELDEIRVITAGVLVSAFAAVFLFLAPTFGLLVVGATIAGIGTGVHKTVAINLLSGVYAGRKGLTLGTMDTIGQFGGVVAPAAVSLFLAVRFDWRYIFLFAGFGLFVLGYLFYIRVSRQLPSVREPNPSSNDTLDRSPTDADDASGVDAADADAVGDQTESYVSMFADRRFALFVVVTVLFTFSWNGVSSFLPLFLVDERSFAPETAGLVYSGFFVMSLAQVVTGGLSDRVGRIPMLAALFGVMAVPLTALLVTSSRELVIPLVLLVGLGFHGFRPVRDSYLMELIPSSVGGGTLGIVRTAMTTVGAFAPAAVGYASEVTDLTHAFAGIAALLFACIPGVLWLAATVK